MEKFEQNIPEEEVNQTFEEQCKPRPVEEEDPDPIEKPLPEDEL